MEWHSKIRDDVIRCGENCFVVQNVNHTERENTEHMKTERDEKLEEVAVITTTNAVIYPRTVVVKHLQNRRAAK